MSLSCGGGCANGTSLNFFNRTVTRVFFNLPGDNYATCDARRGGWALPYLVCTAERGMVFKVLSLRQNMVYKFIISVFNRVSLWTGSLTKSVKVGDSN